MRAYVITLEEYHKENNTATNRVIGLRSSKKTAIQACEEAVSSPFTWDTQDKHSGEVNGANIAVTYEMFYVNEGLTDVTPS